jgi:hypothetical protein
LNAAEAQKEGKAKGSWIKIKSTTSMGGSRDHELSIHIF